MKVLVIDDEAAVRYALARVLRNGGYDVVLADNGEQGLALFDKERPDLVICDLLMPPPSGLETIAQIRRESPVMKIIAISGTDQTINADGLATALETGANEVMVKPFRASELLSQVTSALADPGSAAVLDDGQTAADQTARKPPST
jgi:DNA-binding response OmpR family regulator